MKTTPLQHGKFYHVYNRGINSCNIFKSEDNYQHFLKLVSKYILPVADVYAWVLMPNHFHLLVRVKDDTALNPDRVQNPIGVGSTKPPHRCFGNLFNAYAQAFNKQQNRHGALFERPFKRLEITSDAYLKQLVLYIHCNPIHHGFCNHPYEYPWSSYHTMISAGKTSLFRNKVLEWFNLKYALEGLLRVKTALKQDVSLTYFNSP